MSRWVRIGLALFVVGLVFIAVDVLPWFGGRSNTPLWLNLSCLAAPAGFAIVVGSALRSGRRDQRAAAAALSGDALTGDALSGDAPTGDAPAGDPRSRENEAATWDTDVSGSATTRT